MFSEAAISLWGKTDPDNDLWLPTVHHLMDAGLAAGGLVWPSLLSDSVKNLITEDLGCPESKTRDLVSFLAATHDIGKLSPAFVVKAQKIKAGWGERLLGQANGLGLRIDPAITGQPLIGHGSIGQITFSDWLKDRFFPEATDQQTKTITAWSSIIGGHHGRHPSWSDLRIARENSAQLGSQNWQNLRFETLDELAAAFRIAEVLPEALSRTLPARTQVLLLGITVLADWIASDQENFPLLPVGTSQLTSGNRERLESAKERLSFAEPWQPTNPVSPDDQFRRAFPALANFGMRPLQRAVAQIVNELEEPGLILIEAPMGIGKTEAAFLAAETLARRFSKNGMMLCLPTMATANPLFSRMLPWAKNVPCLGGRAVNLMHGKAAHNAAFSGLVAKSRTGTIFDEEGDGAAYVDSWFRGRRLGVFAPLLVATIDQCLFGALKAKHLALRQTALANKVIILDEIHAADDYMRAYLCRVLNWLGQYQVPVVAMSATLPTTQRRELAAAYQQGLLNQNVEIAADEGTAKGYPQITIVTRQIQTHVLPEENSGTTVAMTPLGDDDATIAAMLKEALSGGGCAAVIRNTVGAAQRSYQALFEEFGADVQLYHSRFLAPDRARREADLVNELGPPAKGRTRPTRRIIVGTQVLEQSLDIDLDLLITDIAPMDLLLQRIGRLHRHDRPRPHRLHKPMCYVVGILDWAANIPKFRKDMLMIYDQILLLKTLVGLKQEDWQISLPSGIPKLVAKVYDEEFLAPSGWEEPWNKAVNSRLSRIKTAQTRANSFLAKTPRQTRNLVDWTEFAVPDPLTSERAGAAQVRDSEESLEVIVVYRDQQGELRILDCVPGFGGRTLPISFTENDWKLAKALASCTVTLPTSVTAGNRIDAVIRELETENDTGSWQTSEWLAGELILVLDSNLTTELLGQKISYHPELGLTVERIKENT